MKLSKGYQFLDLHKDTNIPEIASASILGKRAGQTIHEIEPDPFKKLNSHPNETLQSSLNTIIPDNDLQTAPCLLMNDQKSPRIEQEPFYNPPSPRTPEKMFVDMIDSKRSCEITPEKKENKERKERKAPKLELLKKYNQQIKEDQKNDTQNLLNSPSNSELGSANSEHFFTNKNEENSEIIKSPTNEILEQRREEFFTKLEKVAPGDCPFGEPIFENHDYLTVPSKWENEDVTDWYISEKLGGIRCLWNGLEMWPKSGPQHNLPEFFIERLPKSPLDGELYMKEGNLSRCMMVVKKKPTDPDYEKEWNNVSFVVYDAPEAPGDFQQRLQALKEYFEESDGLYVSLHEYKKCEGKNHAEREFRQEKRKGGEGILLTNPNGEYVNGKSNNVLERRWKLEETAKSKPKILEEVHKAPEPSFNGEEIQNEKGLTKEEFLEKVNSLGPSESRFGKPIFNSHKLLTLPSEWKDEYPSNWYLNKIRGGTRCMWNGFEMRTQNGGLINIPEFLMEALPKSPLDGELCMENSVKTFEEYQVIINLEPEDQDYERIWNDMMFVIYDAPGLSGNFEQRLEKLKEYFEDPETGGGLLYVHLEDYKRCRGKIHAESELEKVLRENGKGIKLTDPLGKYVKGVTRNVLEKAKSRRLKD